MAQPGTAWAGAALQNVDDDLLSTIEEVGLTDIAKECGIFEGRGDDGGMAALMGGGAGADMGAGLASNLQLSQGTTDDSQGGAHSPPTVHMPQCASVGPSVPVELQDMVSSVGGARARPLGEQQRRGDPARPARPPAPAHASCHASTGLAVLSTSCPPKVTLPPLS